ncbi:MAG: CAAX prenyl protease-related protein [Kiritimatiellae bacterium]|nr:CAAX prenyl protease-related protein [Kiritimatiellia bacterium]
MGEVATRGETVTAPVPGWAHLLPFVLFLFVAHLLGDDAWWARLAGLAAAVGALAWQRPWRDAATWAHIGPFATWLTVMYGASEPSAANYTLRTLLAGAMLLGTRPWRWYERPGWRDLPWAVAAGLGVFVLWVGFESDAFRALAPRIAEWYERYLVGPLPGGFGRLRAPMSSYPYLPARTGWIAFGIHMLGTSVVIATAEEFFWRGFLYRWLCARDFRSVSLAHRDVPMFLVVAVLFGLEHTEWFAGVLTGLVYGVLVLRSGRIWPAVFAHGLTNFLLGLHVLRADAWWFW